MKNKWSSVLATLFLGSSLLLTSCGGNNNDMPPESLEGNTQETGVDAIGDVPGTGAEDTTYNDDVPAATGTTSGTNIGTTTEQ